MKRYGVVIVVVLLGLFLSDGPSIRLNGLKADAPLLDHIVTNQANRAPKLAEYHFGSTSVDPKAGERIAATLEDLPPVASIEYFSQYPSGVQRASPLNLRFQRVDGYFSVAAAAAAGTTTRVSVASDGTEGNNESWMPSISSAGRYVAFMSLADNHVENDSNGAWDIFVHDSLTEQTERVSVATDGTEGNDLSGFSAITSDGHYVAFDSLASNLVSDDTNNSSDIFVHDWGGGGPYASS